MPWEMHLESSQTSKMEKIVNDCTWFHISYDKLRCKKINLDHQKKILTPHIVHWQYMISKSASVEVSAEFVHSYSYEWIFASKSIIV